VTNVKLQQDQISILNEQISFFHYFALTKKKEIHFRAGKKLSPKTKPDIFVDESTL